MLNQKIQTSPSDLKGIPERSPRPVKPRPNAGSKPIEGIGSIDASGKPRFVEKAKKF
jgi:hypothetical protein